MLLSFQDTWLYETIAYLWAKFYTIPSKSYTHFTVTDQIAEDVRFILFSVFFGIVLGFLIALPLRKGTARFVQTLMNQKCHDVKSAKTLYELGFFTSYFIRRRLEKGNVLHLVVYPASHPYVHRPEDDESIDKTAKKGKKNEEKTEEKSADSSLENRAETPDFSPADVVVEKSEKSAQNSALSTPADEISSPVEENPTEGENTAENSHSASNDKTLSPNVNHAEKAEKQPKKMDFATERFYIPEELKFRAEMRFNMPKTRWWLFPAVMIGAFLFIGLVLYFTPTLLTLFDNILTLTIGK